MSIFKRKQKKQIPTKKKLEKKMVEPTDIIIGFKPFIEIEKWTDDDWFKFLKIESEKNFKNPTLSSTYIKKVDNGVWYEIHEKGNKHGFLLGVIKKIADDGEIILPVLLESLEYLRVYEDDEGVKNERIKLEKEDLNSIDSYIELSKGMKLFDYIELEDPLRIPEAILDIEKEEIKDKKVKKTKKKFQELDNKTIAAGERLIEELSVDEEFYPKNIMIGFTEGRKKKDLLVVLKDLNEKNFELSKSTTYQAIKYNKGFIYELHEKGNGKGFLTSILPKLEQDGDVILPLENGHFVKILKEKHNIDTIRLPEGDDENIEPDFTERKDKMILLNRPNMIIYKLGLISFFFAMMALSLSLVVKYVIIDTNKHLIYPERNYQTPYEAASSDLMTVQRTERITKMEYINGRWNYEKEDAREIARQQREAAEAARDAEEGDVSVEDLENIEDISGDENE
jgi:hypothetical protein